MKQIYTETFHGSLVVVGQSGVLLLGQAGSGKSSLIYELLKRGHKFVCDDLVQVERMDDYLIGRPPHPLAQLLQRRGHELLDPRYEFGTHVVWSSAPIDLVVHLNEEQNHESLLLQQVDLPELLYEPAEIIEAAELHSLESMIDHVMTPVGCSHSNH